MELAVLVRAGHGSVERILTEMTWAQIGLFAAVESLRGSADEGPSR